ncbi:UNVERIFIED_CONTAM: hypothetical protein Slati_3808700 [Sesamum latifolium]|uniref:Uncharacterized protein n=1 Tax=Sesamum latifolium TaxID=2727402 RepID=A0AAW2U5K4_9LAMI
MFGKHLKDEHRDATTPSATKSLKGIPSSNDQRGKCAASALPGSSSKKPRSGSSCLPPSSFARHTSTPPPPSRDLGTGSSKSPSSPVGGV